MFEKFFTCDDECALSNVFLHLNIPNYVALLTMLIGSLIKYKINVFKYILISIIVFSLIVYLLYELLKWSCRKKCKYLTYFIFFLILTPMICVSYLNIDSFDATMNNMNNMYNN